MKIISQPSPNFNARRAPFDASGPRYVVVHYTDMLPFAAALARMCNPDAEVSAHYAIGMHGTVHQLVDERERAWHAGLSSWHGITDMNSASIGIELDNPGHTNGYVDFPDAQISALVELLRGIMQRHDIPPENIIGHSDIAPARKLDPGEKFPWRALAAQGIGLPFDVLPAINIDDAADTKAKLESLGYDCSDLNAATQAYLRHFAPEALA